MTGDKTLLKGSSAEWLTLTFTYPADSSFQLVKGSDNLWRLSDSTHLNNSTVNTYLGVLSNLQGKAFAESRPSGSPLMQVEVATSQGEPFSVSAFPVDSAHYVVSSSQNPDAFFKGEAGKLWERAFVGKNHFIDAMME